MRMPPEFDSLPLPIKAALWDAAGNHRVAPIVAEYQRRLRWCMERGENDPHLIATQIVVLQIQSRDEAASEHGLGWGMTASPSHQVGVDILHSYRSFYS